MAFGRRYGKIENMLMGRTKPDRISKVNTHFVKGLVLSIGLPGNSTVASIKEFFNKYGDVGYVVYESGQDKSEIQFSGEENGAQEAWNKAVAAGAKEKSLFRRVSSPKRPIFKQSNEERARTFHSFHSQPHDLINSHPLFKQFLAIVKELEKQMLSEYRT
ncbi:hypothetical protein ANCCAN_11809 [Ancylostoma caninum]|uniref:XRRM domain-containing protein n=1 Tax=Ancylostoma caninum TaxID=29170 RepID=A0A368GCU0_ANCCA|nr:hypothetical protein ANCCAN_11809 [Ancylostoma caninum]